MVKKLLIKVIFVFLAVQAIAQNKPAAAKIQSDQPYGVIDTADLAMKQCEFEKDANAEVLFNKGDEVFDEYYDIVFTVHKRIKIFNENGKDVANIKIPFVNRITDLQAETINLNGKTITYTPVDVNLFYKQKVISDVKELTFTFPDVRPGSVIEMQYKWKVHADILPGWTFQEDIPTRYSEINITFRGRDILTLQTNARQPFVKDTAFYLNGRDATSGRKHIRAMADVPSLKTEPFMAQESGVKQKLILKYHANFWYTVYIQLKTDPDFGLQLDNKLAGEAGIVAKMDSIKDKNVRADSIFNLVKKTMTWNNHNAWFTNNGIKKAWAQKTGNSAEINLILCRLLNQANIEAHPMVVSTPDYGPVDPEYASTNQFNKAVVYLPVDSTHFYILDATDKHNVYNVIPFDLLSTYGLEIEPNEKKSGYTLMRIGALKPSRQLVYIKADIKPDGKMSGEANIVSDTYNRSASLALHKALGEKKYIDYLGDNDNNLKISALELDSAEKDSLPLMQRMHIDLDLTASDDNYIYFNPNLLTSFGKNPFLSKDRVSDVDFTFENTYIISGDYGIPQGYKIDVLPQNRTIMMEDKSITFKRIIGEQDGRLLVHYVITRKRSYYKQDEYSGIYNFYKEMFRMLDEQIVFKKS